MAYVLTHADLVEKLQQQVRFLYRSAALYDEGEEDEALRLAQIIRILVHDTSSSHSILAQLGVKDTFDYLDTSERIEPNNRLATMGLVEVKIEWGVGDAVGSYIAPLSGDRGVGSFMKKSPNRSISKKKKRRKKSLPQRDRGIAYMRGAYNSSVPPGPPDPPPYARQIDFAKWWADPVTKDSRGSLFSRSSYVLGCANKEGGAHVDPSLEVEWVELTRNNSLHWRSEADGKVTVIAPGAGGNVLELGNPSFASVRQIAYELDQTLQSHLGHLL